MADSTRGVLAGQVRSFLRSLQHDGGLPFSQLLPAQRIEGVLAELGVTFRDRVFSPVVTLWAFLSQVASKDYSCLQAVARVLAYRLARGRPACSSGTGSYCKARGRLPEELLARLARDSGRQLQQQLPDAWRWKGRRVKIVDGSGVSMPDTAANQKAYPQPQAQKPGLGFPVARLVVVFCFSCGAVLDAALGPSKGKKTGETALLRGLHQGLEAGDLLLADRYYCSFFEIALLRERQVEMVFRQHQRRHVDFRRGRRLGKDDHVAYWTKPARPAWLDEATYARLPGWLAVREVRLHVRKPGFRTSTLVLATTLRDAEAIAAADLAGLYRARWHAELDLRSLKHSLHLDVLRGQTPRMVRKELWAHLLVYNLLRTVLAEAASRHDLQPRQLSFAAARQTLEAFEGLLARASAEQADALLESLLEALARHRVGDRPDRYEPRVRKRRPKQYPLMTEPREKGRKRMAKRA